MLSRYKLLERDLDAIRGKYGFPQPQRRKRAQLVAEGQAEYGSGKQRVK